VIIGGWAFRLAPLPDELLSSCLARNARAHGLSPYRFLALFRQGDPAWDRDFDRDPAALGRAGHAAPGKDWLTDLADLMSLPRADLARATLTSERALLGGPRLPVRGDTPLILSAGIHHRTRTRHALQFCPDCLLEGVPHFRKEWRLAFVVACPAHGRALADACGVCGATVVPHRSFTGRLADCHRCGCDIGSGESASGGLVVSAGAVALQSGMSATLRGKADGVTGPWVDREVFDVVRCLIAASAPAPVQARLRATLAAGDAQAGRDGRQRLEQCRLVVRASWLELVAAWMADWPDSFHAGAEASGLTRRSFARLLVPPSLATEVARLPAGVRRDRSWEPVLEEPVLRRLRRADPVAYRLVRASRILAATGWAAWNGR
jgi:hypothetical protein